jgi:hypothetical protein
MFLTLSVTINIRWKSAAITALCAANEGFIHLNVLTLTGQHPQKAAFSHKPVQQSVMAYHTIYSIRWVNLLNAAQGQIFHKRFRSAL